MTDFESITAASAAFIPGEGHGAAVINRNQPPFTKRRCGKLSVWSEELDLAHGFAQREGLTFDLRDAPYQVARLTGPTVCILIYPHKTKSTGHLSLRVRDENSADPNLADDLMAKMDALAPYCNTFSRHLSMTAWEREKARRIRQATPASSPGTERSEVNKKATS